jgi:hypothetical protein
MKSRFGQFGSAAFISAGAFSVNALIVLGWYLALSSFYTPEQSGRLLLWISAAAMVGLLDVGLSVYVVGRIAELRHLRMHEQAVRTALAALVFSACIFSILSTIVAVSIWHWDLMQDPVKEWVGPFLLLSVTMQLFAVSNGILKGNHKFKTAATCQFFNSILIYGTSIFWIFNAATESKIYLWFAGMSLISTFATTSAALIYCTAKPKINTENQPNRFILADLKILIRGGLTMFPQQLPGIFFNHALRFLVVSISGIQDVTKVSLSFAIAVRMHALGNSFLEVIYPLARSLKTNGTTVTSIQATMWKKGFPVFLVGTLFACLIAQHFSAGDLTLIVLFSAGTWAALLASPVFHMANAMGAGFRISVISLGIIPSFLLVILGIDHVFDVSIWFYGVAYLAAQVLFYYTLRFAFRNSEISR